MEQNAEKQPQCDILGRRDFLLKSIVLIGGTVGASWLISSCGKSNSPAAAAAAAGPSVNFTIDISTTQYKSLQTNGNYVYLNSIIIARDASGNFVALYSICTHAGCTIMFNGSNDFPCPCHGSIFDENGNVVQGPATSPVKKYTCTLQGTQLTVAG